MKRHETFTGNLGRHLGWTPVVTLEEGIARSGQGQAGQ